MKSHLQRVFGYQLQFPLQQWGQRLVLLGLALLSPTPLWAESGPTNKAGTTQATPADLALLSVKAPGRFVYIFDPVPITIEVKNIGGQASGDFTVNFYASDDTHITSADHLLGKETLPSLAPNETATFTSHYTVWAVKDNPQKTWYIGALITLQDSNTGNNVNFDPLPVKRWVSNPFVINNGLNDTWRNPNTRGQGFFITVFPDIQKMFVGWFTYDLERPAAAVTAILGEPGHRWLTAYGPYSADTATLDIELTQGGIFNSGVPAPTQGPYGTMIVKFTSCSEGVVTYDIPSVGVSGDVPIERVANDNVARCEALQNQ